MITPKVGIFFAFLVIVTGLRLASFMQPLFVPLTLLRNIELADPVHIYYFEETYPPDTLLTACQEMLFLSPNIRGGAISWCASFLNTNSPLANFTDDILVDYHVASSYYRRGDYTKAIQIWRNVTNVDVHFAHIGHTYYVQSEQDKALTFFELSGKIDNRIVSGKYAMYADLCVMFRRAGTEEKALQNCLIAVNINPSADGLFLLGRAFYEWGDFKAADASFERAVNIGVPSAYRLAWRGKSQEALGNYPQAESFYRAAIHTDPNYFWAYIFLGDLNLLLGDPISADATYRIVFSLSDSLGAQIANERLEKLRKMLP